MIKKLNLLFSGILGILAFVIIFPTATFFAEEEILQHEERAISEEGIGVKTIAELFPDEILAKAVAKQVSSEDVNVVLTQEMINELTTLHLYGDLQSIDGIELLQGLKNLSIHSEIFQNVSPSNLNIDRIALLQGLETLSLKVNLSELPVSLTSLSNLKELLFFSGIIEKIPENIGNLTNLTTLAICGPDEYTLLDELIIPKSIGNLSNLEDLFLSGSTIKEVPETIGNLSNLKSLTIKITQLSELPESIGNLSNLEELIISENRLLSLPKSISNLKKLQHLGARGNKLIDFPVEILDLTHLELRNLGFSHNQFTTLPSEFLNANKSTPYYGFSDTYLPSELQSELEELGFTGFIFYSIGNFQLKEKDLVYSFSRKQQLESLNIVDKLTTAPFPNESSAPDNYYFWDDSLNPNHETAFENYINEEGVEIDIESYFDEKGRVKEDTTLFAQVRVTGKNSGLAKDTSEWAITNDRVQINLIMIPWFRLTFDLNGGEGTIPEEQELGVGEKAQAVSQPQRINYQFIGWNLSQDGTGLMWDFDSSTMPEEDVILFAQWKEGQNKPEIKDPEFQIPNTGVR